MNKKLCSVWSRVLHRNNFLAVGVWLACLGAGAPPARSVVPDWLRAAARVQLGSYPSDTDGIKLLDEQVTTISAGGEVKTRFRVAYKILRPSGRSLGRVVVYFDSETRLTYLKAWCLSAQGQEYEVKEKEAVEASYPGAGMLYDETRYKILVIPASDPDNVIGYEYEQRQRPNILQDIWYFQEDNPVRQARFELKLPEGWEYNDFWLNHAPEKPQTAGPNDWVWELNDLTAIRNEPGMPNWRAVGGRMAVSYFPRGGKSQSNGGATWSDVGHWYGQLTLGRREISPGIQQKVNELTAKKPAMVDKIAALASFVQHDIRYVGIEIGIGGFQPHSARDIFNDRYGDCKDKVTLLSAMLKAIGIDSYYVLVNIHRGVIAEGFPTALSFDHAILAVRLPADVPTTNLYAVGADPTLGQLLFFDPTDPSTRLGYLPVGLQQNQALLITERGGQIVKLPLLPPAVNRLIRVGNLQVTPQGTLEGSVHEIRWGAPGSSARERYKAMSEDNRAQSIENFLGTFMGSTVLKATKFENLQDANQSLVVDYVFMAKDYARKTGDLLLVRPRIVGEKVLDLNQREEKERKYPVEFPGTTSETDIFSITLPPGYAVDELPEPTEITSPFGEYRSKLVLDGSVLKFQRNYQITTVSVPADRVGELKRFFSQIDTDQRSFAVLKRVPGSEPAPSASASPH